MTTPTDASTRQREERLEGDAGLGLLAGLGQQFLPHDRVRAVAGRRELSAVDRVGQHCVHGFQRDTADVVDVEPAQLGHDDVGGLPRDSGLDDVTGAVDGAVDRDTSQQHQMRDACLRTQGVEHRFGTSTRDDDSEVEHLRTIPFGGRPAGWRTGFAYGGLGGTG
ncbi:hypothetical protein GCM10029964_106310 [Kibdelosporangium lantanae]